MPRKATAVVPASADSFNASRHAPEIRPYVRRGTPVQRIALRALGAILLCMAAFYIGRRYTADPRSLLLLATPLCVMALMVVWALPKQTQPPTSALSFCFFGLMFALVLWPNYLGANLPGMPWITAVRLFGFPLFFLFLICLSVSAEFRASLVKVLSIAPPIWKMLAAFTFLQFLSLPFSSEIGVSFQKLLIYQVFCASLVLIAAYVGAREGRVSLWVALFTACALPICIIGFLEARKQQVLWAGHVPSFLTIDDPIVQRILMPKARAASGIYRVQGPSTTPLGLAEYLAFVTPFLIFYAVESKKFYVKATAIMGLPVIFRVIILTDSRLGVVGFGLSFLLYALVWGWTNWRNNKSSIVGPALTLSFPAVFAVSIAASFVLSPIRRVVWGNGAQQFSDESRKIQVAMGLPKVILRPLGYGWGRSAEVLGFTNLAGVITIDSYFLALALDVGPLGLILFLAMFLYLAYRAFSASTYAKTMEERLLAPLAITFVNFLVIKSIFAQDANHPMIFMMVGLTLALLSRQRQRLLAEAG